MNYPMREKYIDEKVGVWFIFGTHPDGTVDINDGQKDIFEKLPKDVAEKLCDWQASFRIRVYQLISM